LSFQKKNKKLNPSLRKKRNLIVSKGFMVVITTALADMKII